MDQKTAACPVQTKMSEAELCKAAEGLKITKTRLILMLHTIVSVVSDRVDQLRGMDVDRACSEAFEAMHPTWNTGARVRFTKAFVRWLEGERPDLREDIHAALKNMEVEHKLCFIN